MRTWNLQKYTGDLRRINALGGLISRPQAFGDLKPETGQTVLRGDLVGSGGCKRSPKGDEEVPQGLKKA